jgi:hypothetical protein
MYAANIGTPSGFRLKPGICAMAKAVSMPLSGRPPIQDSKVGSLLQFYTVKMILKKIKFMWKTMT